MASKKEKLKFYRLPTVPSYRTDAPAVSIRGYKNKYPEFVKYDTQPSTAVEANLVSGSYPGDAPVYFFGDKVVPYSSLEFVIDGIFEAYDRSRYDLASLSSKIYILETTSAGTFGISYDNYPTTDAAFRKPYVEPLSTAFLESISFYVNPTTIRIRKKKFFQKLRTRAGWVFQHWGPDIGEITLEGTTGNITPDPKIQVGKVFGLPILPQVVEEAPTKSNSPALKAFRILEQWYDEDQNDQSQSASVGQLTALEFRGRIYVGHFAEFNFEERGTHPFQLFYQLKFLIHYDTGALSDATTRSVNQIIRNDETLRKILELKKAQSESETLE
ncbi:hypothetical protein LCGC14_0959470 [marine sediment metagenome]|uniref:Uncharacterized protein n=1 Tax=marine sediment metagenome TaxID=412755 RepID=A0A0F9NJK4_9ZZZZ